MRLCAFLVVWLALCATSGAKYTCGNLTSILEAGGLDEQSAAILGKAFSNATDEADALKTLAGFQTTLQEANIPARSTQYRDQSTNTDTALLQSNIPPRSTQYRDQSTKTDTALLQSLLSALQSSGGTDISVNVNVNVLSSLLNPGSGATQCKGPCQGALFPRLPRPALLGGGGILNGGSGILGLIGGNGSAMGLGGLLQGLFEAPQRQQSGGEKGSSAANGDQGGVSTDKVNEGGSNGGEGSVSSDTGSDSAGTTGGGSTSSASEQESGSNEESASSNGSGSSHSNAQPPSGLGLPPLPKPPDIQALFKALGLPPLPAPPPGFVPPQELAAQLFGQAVHSSQARSSGSEQAAAVHALRGLAAAQNVEQLADSSAGC